MPYVYWSYSKTCVKRPLKNRQTQILIIIGSLMKVKSIAECSPLEHSAILLTCITIIGLKLTTIFGIFESGRFTQVLLYFANYEKFAQHHCY